MQTETLNFEAGTPIMLVTYDDKDYMCFTSGEMGLIDNSTNRQVGELANTTLIDLDVEDQIEDSNGNIYTRVYEYYYYVVELFNQRPPLK